VAEDDSRLSERDVRFSAHGHGAGQRRAAERNYERRRFILAAPTRTGGRDYSESKQDARGYAHREHGCGQDAGNIEPALTQPHDARRTTTRGEQRRAENNDERRTTKRAGTVKHVRESRSRAVGGWANTASASPAVTSILHAVRLSASTQPVMHARLASRSCESARAGSAASYPSAIAASPPAR
jgi:hypothetical protein